MKVKFEYNGIPQEHEIHPGALLSELLGEEVTAILLDGRLVRTDMLLAAQAHQRELTSPSGVRVWHEFIPASVKEPYTSAQILNAYLLSQHSPQASAAQIEEAFADLLSPTVASEPRPEALQGLSG